MGAVHENGRGRPWWLSCFSPSIVESVKKQGAPSEDYSSRTVPPCHSVHGWEGSSHGDINTSAAREWRACRMSSSELLAAPPARSPTANSVGGGRLRRRSSLCSEEGSAHGGQQNAGAAAQSTVDSLWDPRLCSAEHGVVPTPPSSGKLTAVALASIPASTLAFHRAQSAAGECY